MDEGGQDTSREQLEHAIAILEAQRATLGDAVVEAALEPMRQKLQAMRVEAAPQQQRKLATILFMDIAGHTQIVRDLDPEENMALIDSALARLDDPIFKFGGHIARYQGDGFKAVFGLPRATEDDPANAVRAGLAILAESRQIAAEIQKTWGIESFIVRVGIDTGMIFAGGETEGEDTIKGNPVNMAARLESAAQPGTLLISHNTHQHVLGLFDVLSLEPVVAKGYPRPVRVYRVTGAKERAFQRRWLGIEGIETRLVGREYELSLLQDAFRSAVESRECHFVTIEGDEGIGKSRLVYEFENWVDQGDQPSTMLHGRARPEAQRLPYSLVRDIFAIQFGIRDDDPVETVRLRFEKGIAETLGEAEAVQMQAHFIGYLLGYDFQTSVHLQSALEDPRQIRNRALLYLTAYLQSAAQRTPFLALVEDLQWADENSLELIVALAAAMRGLPALFVATARPAFFERHPNWMQGMESHQRLGLYPLRENIHRQLIAEILQGVSDIPPELFDLIVQRAEGNPFYTEELIKKLIDDGVIYQQADTWQVKGDQLTQISVPPTLIGLLQARIDSLESVERSILQQASVVGRVFWDAILEYLNQNNSKVMTGENIDIVLDSLQLKEMVYRRALSTFNETTEHIFKHAALQEVAYEGVLLRLRRIYHTRVAEWLIEHSQDRTVEIAGLIADHLEKASEDEMAVKYLHMAGDQAAAIFANHEAVKYYTRALGNLPEGGQATRFEILLALNQIYDRQGNRLAQEGDLPILEALAASIPGDPADRAVRQAKVALRQSKYYEAMGQFDLAAQAAEKTVSFANAGGDSTVEAAGLIRWTVALWRQGFYDQAQELAGRALSLTQNNGIHLYEAHALIQMGHIAFFHDQMDQAVAFYERALPIYHQLDYHLGMAATSMNLNLVEMNRGNLDLAKIHAQRGLDEYTLMGDTQGIASVHGALGSIRLRQCEFKEAVREFQVGIDLTHEIGDRNLESIMLLHLGNIFLSAGDLGGARGYLMRSLEIAKDLGNRRSQCFALTDLGMIYSLEGDHASCKDLLEQALKLSVDIGLEGVKANVLTTYGHALLAAGEFGQAQAFYEEVRSFNDRIESHQTVLQVQTGLARLALAQGDHDLATRYTGNILNEIDEIEYGEGVMWFLNHLTCIRVMQAVGDPRASAILESAYELLCQRHDQVRTLGIHQEFIENIPWHQEIVRLWEKQAG